MINEHALTYKERLNQQDINYLVQKAHYLGTQNRKIARVFQQEDDEGIHVYFEVESMKEKKDHV